MIAWSCPRLQSRLVSVHAASHSRARSSLRSPHPTDWLALPRRYLCEQCLPRPFNAARARRIQLQKLPDLIKDDPTASSAVSSDDEAPGKLDDFSKNEFEEGMLELLEQASPEVCRAHTALSRAVPPSLSCTRVLSLCLLRFPCVARCFFSCLASFVTFSLLIFYEGGNAGLRESVY